MKNKRTFANIKEDIFLFGQKSVCSFVVDAIAERLLSGDRVPPLHVQRISKKCWGVKDGAHRLIAYKKIEKNPEIFEPYMFYMLNYYVDLETLSIEEDLSGNRKYKFIEALSYFPKKRAGDFCLEHGLDPVMYLSQ